MSVSWQEESVEVPGKGRVDRDCAASLRNPQRESAAELLEELLCRAWRGEVVPANFPSSGPCSEGLAYPKADCDMIKSVPLCRKESTLVEAAVRHVPVEVLQSQGAGPLPYIRGSDANGDAVVGNPPGRG